jgi:tryptophan synthase beta subunit
MTVQQPNSFRTGPDERGHFGIYGGRFVAETLMPLILELEAAYAEGQNRSEIPEGDGRSSRKLRGPAVVALFRRTANAALRRGKNLFQA